MKVKSFDEMTKEDIINTLNLIASKYGVRYYSIGYSTEGINNTLMVCIYSDIEDCGKIRHLIHDIFLGMCDIDGNPVTESPDYPDDICPYISVYDTDDTDFVDMWIEDTERYGEIVWVKRA